MNDNQKTGIDIECLLAEALPCGPKSRGSKIERHIIRTAAPRPHEVLRFTAREVRIPEGSLQSPGRALEAGSRSRIRTRCPRPVICESRYQMELIPRDGRNPCFLCPNASAKPAPSANEAG